MGSLPLAIERKPIMKKLRIESPIKAALLAGVLAGLLPVSAHAQDNFYAGKTVTLVATTAPGGTGDLRVKAMMPFLRRIPASGRASKDLKDTPRNSLPSELPRLLLLVRNPVRLAAWDS
jgi:hypothetical protein